MLLEPRAHAFEPRARRMGCFFMLLASPSFTYVRLGTNKNELECTLIIG